MVCTFTNKLLGSWLDVSSHNVGVPALSIRHPDCHGYLQKVGNHLRTWRRRYCVLKYACLYYYVDPSSNIAKGVAHLHGYTVADDNSPSRKFGFQLVPPQPNMRLYQFTADNETVFKRFSMRMVITLINNPLVKRSRGLTVSTQLLSIQQDTNFSGWKAAFAESISRWVEVTRPDSSKLNSSDDFSPPPSSSE